MVARGALWNASIFRREGQLPWEDVKREYLHKSLVWDNCPKYTKHTLKEMIIHHSSLELPEGKAITQSRTLEDIVEVYGEQDFYKSVLENRKQITSRKTGGP
eukprot:TRINITY_DN13739_c0_g1_i3.p1 TRINITY_DN13739_c0_g1~~TRINITY_DN13739_c0_g1_i3.p1  ORF type:complete len:102 (-),score=20.21 TRINITY_DN13739_c0_g1_i3:345-650(-)